MHLFGSSPDLTVLLVCTGNICRSALGERLGRAYLDQALGREAGRIQLVSAGTRAVVGSEMHPDSALVLRGFGGEPGDFRARQLTSRIVAKADLVLTMTRRHRSAVLEEAPRSLSRTFTLREAADLVGRLDEQLVPAGDDFPARARSFLRELAGVRALRQVGDGDDVADPIGRPLEAHQAAGEAIAASLLPVLERLVRLARTPPAGRGRTVDDVPA